MIRRRKCQGQSLVETLLSMLIVCLLFSGLIQISQLYAAKEVLYEAAVRGARAKTVGFNWHMVEKSILVGAIPNAGRITAPDYESTPNLEFLTILRQGRAGEAWDYALRNQPDSSLHRWERNRIPDFLASDSVARGRMILDYEDWDSIGSDHTALTTNMALVRVVVWQDYPLKMPAHRAFYAADTVRLEAEYSIENHYEAYMDEEWR